MKHRSLPLSLTLPVLLPLLGACGGDGTVSAQDDSAVGAAQDAAGKLLGAAEGAASAIAAKFQDVDLSSLSPEKMEAMGGEAVAFLTQKLGEIRDSDTAKKVAEAVQPVLDSAGGLLEQLGDQLPSRAQLKTKVDELRARYAGDAGVMKHLEPVLSRLSEILG